MANMKTTKNAYLEKLTRQIQMKSVKVGKIWKAAHHHLFLLEDGPILKFMQDL